MARPQLWVRATVESEPHGRICHRHRLIFREYVHRDVHVRYTDRDVGIGAQVIYSDVPLGAGTELTAA